MPRPTVLGRRSVRRNHPTCWGNWREHPCDEVAARHFREGNPRLHEDITYRGRGLFLDVLPVKAGGVYLDVGSGWGQAALALAKEGAVFCLDSPRVRLEILRAIAEYEGCGLQYVCGDFRTFPFAENQFDLVIFNGSLGRLRAQTKNQRGTRSGPCSTGPDIS